MKKIAMVTLVMILGTAAFAYAGESITIGISCTIPAIPGVNVPAEPQAATLATSTPVVSTQVQAKEISAKEEPILLTKLDDTGSGTVQIMYSR